MIAPPAFDPWVAALGARSTSDSAGGSAKQAAQQFEALLIRQFLTNARSTGWLSGEQESESGWREIADDSLAGYLVKSGGLGLAKQVEALITQASLSRSGRDVGAMPGSPQSPNRFNSVFNRDALPTVNLQDAWLLRPADLK
jgi:Rod binding domain-containing protein